MKTRITKRAVDATSAGERDGFLWDTALAGFGLKVTPAGKNVYVLQYRANGRVRRYTIGTHGSPWTPEQARAEAKRLLGEVAAGADPAERKGERRKSPTVNDVCDRYLSEHVEIHNKPSTAREFRRLVGRRIRPALGATKAASVSRQDIARLHHGMRNTPRQANQVLAVLSKIFNLAELLGIRPSNSNPCRLIQRYRENTRDRFYSDAELGRIGAALSELESNGTTHPSATAVLRVLALTGCRLGDILRLRWEEVEFEERALRLQDAKAGPRVHPIGGPALALLGAQHKVEGSRWVFNGAKEGHPISVSTVEAAWQQVREKAELVDARIHDLRHTVGTYAGQTGANAFLIRDKLGHRTLAMAGRYVSKADDPLHALTERVEGRIHHSLLGETPMKIVDLHKSQA